MGNRKFSYFFKVLSNRVENKDRKIEILKSKKNNKLIKLEIKNPRLPSTDFSLLYGSL